MIGKGLARGVCTYVLLFGRPLTCFGFGLFCCVSFLSAFVSRPLAFGLFSLFSSFVDPACVLVVLVPYPYSSVCHLVYLSCLCVSVVSGVLRGWPVYCS